MAVGEPEIRERFRALVAGAPDLAEVLRGTVRKRYVRYSREGCCCKRGRGHGPVHYLSVSFAGGRSKQLTLGAEGYKAAKVYAKNYARLRAILEEVSALNRELLRLSRSGHES